MPTKKHIRVVLAKLGLDGHDRGVRVVAQGLRDAGMEVIYTGLWQTPQHVARAAADEDADAVGISLLSGAHLTLVPKLMAEMKKQRVESIPVMVGGTIPDGDIPALKSLGVAKVFTPGTPMDEIVAFLRNRTAPAKSLRVERDAENIVTITFDVPDKSVNVFTTALLDELDSVLASLDEPRGVVFTSAKRVFIAGADVSVFVSLPERERAAFIKRGQEVFSRIESLPFPTVAAITGHCLGGGLEFALACRYRVAVDDEKIKIGLPETKLGLIPAWGGTVRLPRLTGLQHAAELIVSGDTPSPRRALALGIVDTAVPADRLVAIARKMVLLRPPVLRHAPRETIEATGRTAAQKKALDVLRIGSVGGPSAGFAAELKAINELLGTKETQETIKAFLNRPK